MTNKSGQQKMLQWTIKKYQRGAMALGQSFSSFYLLGFQYLQWSRLLWKGTCREETILEIKYYLKYNNNKININLKIWLLKSNQIQNPKIIKLKIHKYLRE